MIIEFLGLPGSGKTTLKSVLIKSLEGGCLDQRYVVLCPYFHKTIIRIVQNLSLTKLGLPNRFVKPLVNLAKYRGMQKFNEWNESYQILISSLCKYVEGEASISNKVLLAMESFSEFSIAKSVDSLTLFDEGPAQRGVSLARNGISCEDIRKYYRLAPKPDLLVVTEVSTKLSKMRVEIRDGKSTRLARKQMLMKDAVYICKENYIGAGIKVCCIDTSKSIKDNILILKEEIKQFNNR